MGHQRVCLWVWGQEVTNSNNIIHLMLPEEAIIEKRSPDMAIRQPSKMCSCNTMSGQDMVRRTPVKDGGAIREGDTAFANITQGNIGHQNTENKTIET